MISQLILFLLYILRALTSENCIPSYFTISKNCFINYTIPFYNIPNIPKLYYFTILLKYIFLISFQQSFFFKFNYSNGQFSTTCQFFFFFSFNYFNNLPIFFQLFQQPANFFFEKEHAKY